MAELVLEQILLLNDSLEKDDYSIAEKIIQKDDIIDSLEKQNDNLSQTAILEAVVNRNIMGMGSIEEDILLKKDPLRFALSAIRITRNIERMGDQVVNIADVWKNAKISKGFFKREELFSKILSRVVTLGGMAVESLVEEKERFMGSVTAVEEELNALCYQAFDFTIKNESIEKEEFADLYRIILAMERIGDYSVNIAEELVRLNTGKDIRHLENSAVVERD
jgi:phosphate transport system protein